MKMKILYAELGGVERRLTVELLEKRGHQVVAVANGKNLLRELNESFDVVIAAYELPPEMDGLELLGLIRGDERFFELPVIVHSMEDEIREDVTWSGGIFVKKDGRIETLVAALNEAAEIIGSRL